MHHRSLHRGESTDSNGGSRTVIPPERRRQGSDPARLERYYEGLLHRSLALEAMRAGQFSAAEGHFRKAIEYLGPRASLAAYLCNLYAGIDQFDRLAVETAGAVDANPSDEGVWRKLAQAQWRAGRRQAAMATLTRGLRKFTDSSELLMQLGLFHASRRRYDKACDLLTRAAQGDCTNADLHFRLGLVESARGDVLAALRCFQRGWELRPDDLILPLHLAIAAGAASQQGRPVTIRLVETSSAQPARTHVLQLATYVQSDPDFVDAFTSLPRRDRDEKLFEVLATVLKVALRQHRRYADLHLRLSRVLERLGQFDAALKHARIAARINPRYVQALIQLGRLHDRMGRGGRAIVNLRRAIRYGADWPDIHRLTGQLMGHHNMEAGAQRHFKREAELISNHHQTTEEPASSAA